MRVVILISLLALFAHVNAGEFKYYVFACEWAGSVCQTNSCDQDDGVASEFWNIHGLWPSDGHEGLNYCTDEKFNPNEISNLKTQLAEYWSGLYSSADSFHSHEWSKHGTCSNMTQEDFFSTVLKLAQNIDVYATLSKSGITPGGSYTCDQVAQALRQDLGITGLSVQSDDNGNLSAVQMCFDRDLNAVDCPDSSGNTDVCSGSVNYPTFNPSEIKLVPTFPYIPKIRRGYLMFT